MASGNRRPRRVSGPPGRRHYLQPVTGWRVALAVCLCLSVSAPRANPEGADVTHGSAAFEQPAPGTLNISNSPGTIINWQQFGIAPGELTRFLQESSASAVLNRVVGRNPSEILGALRSNGRVFLINPNGIVFGVDAVVDTAGLIASTLNMTDEDFLAGRLAFAGGGAGNLSNLGVIRAGAGGNIALIAPNVENQGTIQVEDGHLVLAAGQQVTITDWSAEGISFEVQAPDNEVVNLGELLAEGGSVAMFGGTLRNAGTVQASSIGLDAQGNVVLRAAGDVVLEASSDIDVSGDAGGVIRIESAEAMAWVMGELDATGERTHGGAIHVFGDRVAVTGTARLDASGASRGGEVLLGGDYQGSGDAPTAEFTFIGGDARIAADAAAGDGGRVIAWADHTTRVHGELSARGGGPHGHGGLVETSGKVHLEVTRAADVSSEQGGGEWLLDPGDIEVIGRGNNLVDQDPLDPQLDDWRPEAAPSPGGPSQIDALVIVQALQQGNTTVILDTTDVAGLAEDGDIIVSEAINALDIQPGSTLELRAHRNIELNAPIDVGGSALDIRLLADENDRDGVGDLVFGGDVFVRSNGGDVELSGADIRIDANNGNVVDTTEFQGLDGDILLRPSRGDAPISILGGEQFNVEDIELQALIARLGVIAIGDPSLAGTLSVEGRLDSSLIAASELLLANDVIDINAPIDFAGDFESLTLAATTGAGINADINVDGGQSATPVFLNLGVINWRSGTINIGQGATLENRAGAVFNDQISDARFNLTGSGPVFQNGTWNFGATVDHEVEQFFSASGVTSVFNNGISLLGGMSVDAPGRVNLVNSQIVAGGNGLRLNRGARLEGSGDIVGTVDNSGVVAPGIGSVGSLNLDFYQQRADGTLILEVAGTADPGVDFDLLSVGSANLAGELLVLRTGAYVPQPGDRFVPIVCGEACNGTFDTLTAPAGIDIFPEYPGNNVTVTFIPVSTVQWDGGGQSTLWSNPLNWSTNQLPDVDDDVLIGSNVTVNHDVANGTHRIESLYSFGDLDITGGTLQVTSSMNVEADLSLGSGAGLQVDAGASVAGNFSWTGGVLSGAGVFETLANVTIDGNGVDHTLTGLTWQNNGVANWTDGDIVLSDASAIVDNLSGAVFNVQTALTQYDIRGAGSFDNAGTLNLSSTAASNTFNVPVTNSGTVAAISGDTVFARGYSQTAGSTVLAGGDMGVIGAFQLAGGAFSGSGRASGALNNTGAVIRPGGAGAIGSLQVPGQYTQGPGGSIEIEVSGLVTAGVDYDLLFVDVGQLGGDLDMIPIGRYVPSANDALTPVVCGEGCNGAFANVTGPPGVLIDPTYNPTNVLLTVGFVSTAQWDNGGADNLWSNRLNWVGDNLPGMTDLVFIPGGLGNSVDFDTAAGNQTIDALLSNEVLDITGGSLTVTGGLTMNADLSLTTGLTLPNGGSVAGNFTWNGGVLSGAGDFTTSGTTSVTGNVQHTLTGLNWLNTGTVNWTQGDIALNDVNSLITNDAGATFNVQTTALAYDISGVGNFDNDGDLVFDPAVDHTLNVDLDNSGRVSVVNNTISLAERLTNSGDIDIASRLQGGGDVTLALEQGTALSGSGVLAATPGTLLEVNTAVVLPAGLTLEVNTGSVVASAQNLTLNGALDWLGGDIRGTGTFQTNGATTISGAAVDHTLAAGLGWQNNGTVTWTGGDIVLQDANSDIVNAPAATFDVQTAESDDNIRGLGSFDNAGSLNFDPAADHTLDVPFTNSGTVDVNANLVTFASGYTQSSGATRLLGGNLAVPVAMILDGGALEGAGTVTGDVVNNAATVRPGGAGTPGIVDISGNYQHGANAVLEIELDGTTPGGGPGFHDQVIIGGDLSLAAASTSVLSVVEIGQFTASADDSFDILTFATLTGTAFGTESLPNGFNPATYDNGIVNLLFPPLSSIVTWTGLGNDDLWSNVANWDTGIVPGQANEDVVISANGPVVLESGDHSINSLICDVSFTMDGGSLTVAGNADINAGLTLNSGTLTLNGNSSSLDTAFANTIATGLLINNGSLDLLGAGTLALGSGQLTNSGTLNITGDADITGGALLNTGTLDKSGLDTTTTITSNLDNDAGVVNVNAGTLELQRFSNTFGGTARFNVAAAARLDFDGEYLFTAGTSIAGAGDVGFSNAVQMTVNGGYSVTGQTVVDPSVTTMLFGADLLDANISVDNAALTLSGASSNLASLSLTNAATLTNNSVWTIDAGDSVQLSATAGGIVNNRVINFLGDADIAASAAQTLTNNATGDIVKSGGAGTSSIGLAIANDGGLVRSQSGTLALSGGVTQSAGETRLEGGDINTPTLTLNGGSLQGTGILGGDVVNNAGVLRPGLSGVASGTGILQIDGDYTQGANGTLAMQLNGTAPGAGYDQLLVNGGDAALAGTLDVALVSGFAPASGNNFDLVAMNGGTLTGTFANTQLPAGFQPPVYGPGVSVLFLGANVVLFDNGAGNFLWSDPDNWVGDALPGAGNDVRIDLGGGNTIILSTGSFSVAGLVTEENFSIVGGSLSVLGSADFNAGIGISSGTLALNGASTLGAVTQSGGRLEGSGNWTVTGPLSLLGGTLAGTGSTSLLGGVDINGAVTLDRSVSLNSAGNWRAGTVSGSGSVTVGAENTFTVSVTDALFSPLLSNDGTVTIGPGAGATFGAGFDNAGLVDIDGALALAGGGVHTGGRFDLGGTLRLRGDHGFDAASRVEGNGNVIFDPGNMLFAGFYGPQGTTTVNGAAVTLNADSGPVGTYTQNAGITLVNANLAFSPGATFELLNGTLGGSGSVLTTVNAPAGTISPGTSPGTLVVDGDLILGAGAVLDLELGGLEAGTEYDQLIVTGEMIFAGGLEIGLVNSFSGGDLGDTYQPVSFQTSSGRFDSVTPPPGYRYEFRETGFGLELVTAATPTRKLGVQAPLVALDQQAQVTRDQVEQGSDDIRVAALAPVADGDEEPESFAVCR